MHDAGNPETAMLASAVAGAAGCVTHVSLSGNALTGPQDYSEDNCHLSRFPSLLLSNLNSLRGFSLESKYMNICQNSNIPEMNGRKILILVSHLGILSSNLVPTLKSMSEGCVRVSFLLLAS